MTRCDELVLAHVCVYVLLALTAFVLGVVCGVTLGLML